jgi:hypothetical protein
MKYNIGDKVINKENISYLFNPFWKDNYRKGLIQKVKDASEEYFTVSQTVEYGFICGANNYVLHYQSSGKQYYGNKIYLHLIKDHNEIIELINKIGSEKFKKEDDFITDKINRAIYEKERLRETFDDDLKIATELVNID